MANSYFQFQQFRIYHDQCAMKITQDACIFGAAIDPANAEHILDIGCGSGILSVMLAQRSSALIQEIDIEEGAINQSNFNINQSPFNNQFKVIHQDINHFAKDHQHQFDLIISNPPYYTDQDQGKTDAYNKARHSNASLDFDALANSVNQLLSLEGKFWFILPIYEFEKLLKSLKGKEIYPESQLLVKHNEQSKNARMIVCCTRFDKEVKEDSLIVRALDNSYTAEFKDLMKDYYIKF